MAQESTSVAALIAAAQRLSQAVDRLDFAPPVSHVYNPLDYAWAPHEAYLRRFGNGHKRIIFLGMNPGPFGMVQCGVPFGEIAAARDWMGIEAPVGKPAQENPKRPIEGFACLRSEVSGRRLWGLFEQRFLVTLRVTNPNDDSVTIDGVEFNLELNGQHFASGVGNERITLPRMGDAQVKLSVTTNLGSLWKQLRALQGGKPIGYRMAGKLYTPWLPGGIRFDRKGELPGLGEFLPEAEHPKTEKL